MKTSVFPESSHDTGLSPEKQDELIRNAVKICWKMLMLPRPMFVCQPEAFSDNLHKIHRKSWHDGPKLVYYKPVLMRCAGGTCAIKGLVGRKPSTGTKNMYMPTQHIIISKLPPAKILNQYDLMLNI